jgi:hypothetical protein
MATLQDQLREAIAASGLSSYRIGKDADVPHQVIYRFATGQRDDLRLSTASKLADYFGMRLTAPRQRKKGGK